MSDRIKHRHVMTFGSIAEAAAKAQEVARYAHKVALQDRSCGGLSFNGAVSAASNPPRELAERVARMVDKIEAEAPSTHGATHWAPSVFGGFVSVPDYLAGEPECMRVREYHKDAFAPVHIITDSSHCWKVSSETMERRGAAIAALSLRLASYRPTRVSVCGIGGARKSKTRNFARGHAGIVAIDVDLQSIDIGSASYLIAHPAASRRILFPLKCALLECPDEYEPGPRFSPPEVFEALKAEFSQGDQVKVHFIPSLDDDYFPTGTALERWINTQLEKIGAE